ncbi:MAG TPA: hypothetical protein VJ850_09650 [Candidatus Limnocylindrales bacterium]|nr:hypothetical protein [Candidatus Limnocylindrales bacterium]
MTRHETCVLCGASGRDVHRQLVEWSNEMAEARGGRPFDNVLRCDDRLACRARSAAAGVLWPLNDGTPDPAPATVS